MDDALELSEYLPQSFANANEQTYLNFLWSAFQTNYEAERYEFASLAFHLLYMSFVSFSIWQIKLARPEQFAMAMIGLRSEDESILLESDSPFRFYDRLKESQIFRFLKLTGCNNQQVGEFAKFVKRRNKIAHPTGTVFFNDQTAIDQEIAEMMKEVRNIEKQMEPVIRELCLCFLRESADAEEREYSVLEDEITANFIHKNYMSAADIAFCRDVDIESLDDEPFYDAMKELHDAVTALYPAEENMEAA